MKTFNDTIAEVQINSDTVPGYFIGQKQPNYDFWVLINNSKNLVKRCIGIL